MQAYASSIVGLMVLSSVPLVLAGLSGPAKGKSGLTGGPVADARDENRVYRIDRAHMNAVETLGPFTVAAVLAIWLGLSPEFLAWLVWLQVAIRLAYTVIYIRGGPAAKGGNLRTVVFLLGTALSAVLIVATAWRALN